MVHPTFTGDSWSISRLVVGDNWSGGRLDSRLDNQLCDPIL
jgi:hypothetical protein